MFDGIGDRELRACLTQTCPVLGCRVDWDVQDRSGFDHLLSGEDAVRSRLVAGSMKRKHDLHFLIFPDCRSELLLNITDTACILVLTECTVIGGLQTIVRAL